MIRPNPKFWEHTREELEALYELALATVVVAAMEKVGADPVAMHKQAHAWREAAMTMHQQATARGLLYRNEGMVQ